EEDGYDTCRCQGRGERESRHTQREPRQAGGVTRIQDFLARMSNLLRVETPAIILDGKVGDEIGAHWPPGAAVERIDTHRRSIAAPVGHNKSEPLVFVPVCYSGCKSHCCLHQQLIPE